METSGVEKQRMREKGEGTRELLAPANGIGRILDRSDFRSKRDSISEELEEYVVAKDGRCFEFRRLTLVLKYQAVTGRCKSSSIAGWMLAWLFIPVNTRNIDWLIEFERTTKVHRVQNVDRQASGRNIRLDIFLRCFKLVQEFKSRAKLITAKPKCLSVLGRASNRYRAAVKGRRRSLVDRRRRRFIGGTLHRFNSKSRSVTSLRRIAALG